MMTLSTDVLVVGAGPVGLATAAKLSSLGVSVIVVDKQPAGANTSRAAVIHPRTLEALDEIEVSERLRKLAIESTEFSIRDRDRVLVPLRFDNMPSRYRHMLMIPQSVTEEVLLDRLAELGVSVLRPRELTALLQSADGIVATVDGGEEIHARYAVGADGMHSTVRSLAGIGFGTDHGDESFALADVRLDGGLPPAEVILFFSISGMVVAAPLPDGSFRIVARVDDPPESPSVAYVQELLRTRGPARVPVTVREVVWGSRFRVHHRVADRFRDGRVLLAGDAAHVHSPAGGQGMNLGLRDAIALGAAIAEVLDGAEDSRLDDYANVQRPLAKRVVRFAGFLTRLATVGPRIRPLRNVMLSGLARIPAFRYRLAKQLAGLADR
jgi:2-polyprenyl-6-methoxyphenol hydroxylase-like FAD-dependent oxidoreductase